MTGVQTCALPISTSASQVAVTTGTNIKTMLQVKASSTIGFLVVEWGISFDGSAAATPIEVELIEGDSSSGSTVTAHVAAGIVKLDGIALAGGDPTTNLFPVGTTSTGYTSTGEGTNTTARLFDVQFIAPTNQYVKQFPLGLEPISQVSCLTKIRVTAGAAVNCYCYVVVRV